LVAMSSMCLRTRATNALRARARSSSSAASSRRRKSSSGNLASTGTSPPPRRTTASTRSPLRKACWSVKWAGAAPAPGGRPGGARPGRRGASGRAGCRAARRRRAPPRRPWRSPRAARRGLLHLAHHARGVVEPLADGGLAALHQLEALAQAVVHLPREQSQLLTDELPLTGERLAQLSAERVELLLQEEQRPRVVVGSAGAVNLPASTRSAHSPRAPPPPSRPRPSPAPPRPSGRHPRALAYS